MSEIAPDPELEKALEELHLYLSDQLAPLMVADSIEYLLKHPPTVVAYGIHSWLSGLTRRDMSIPISDYIYHAITKFHQIQEYKLVSPAEFSPFWEGLKLEIVNYCPPEEWEGLKKNLDMIGSAPTSSLTSSPNVVIRPTSSSEQAPAKAEPVKEQEIRHLGYVLSRLERRISMVADPAVAAPVKDQVVTESLAEAARTANEAGELKKTLEHLKQLGIQAGPDDVFRALGRSMPGWSLSAKIDSQVPENSSLLAMRRIISKAPDPAESSNQFRHMIKAAVERFNDGSLPQAAAMFDLASKIIHAKEVDPKAVELVIMKSHENLDDERMRKYTEVPDQHFLLRKVMSFFPALSVQGLLEAVYDCPKRERRKLMLVLLEIHGEETRSRSLEYLKQPLDPNVRDIELWYRRNLIYLLRRISAPESESLEQTVNIVLPYIELNLIPMLIKETLAYLPFLRHERVEASLKKMLLELESMLAKPEIATLEKKEIHQLLDRVISCLCRLDTQTARAAVLDHTLKKKPDNEAIVRLAEFSNYDLSEDPDTLNRLMENLQANLPLKRLGIPLPQKDFIVKWIVMALSGTTTSSAHGALQDLAQRYPELSAGKAAANALTKQNQVKAGAAKKPAEAATASLTGDLALFGLPALLQSLSDNTLTGTLNLKNPKGDVFCSLVLQKGRMKSCRHGVLSGELAFFQLLEKPEPGTFQFIKALEAAKGSEASLPELLPLMLEGLRRNDELQSMRALVPDEARIKAKAPKPIPLPGEKDGLFFRDLWMAVQNETKPVDLEISIVMDAYRIRRMLAHWLENNIIEAL